MSDDTLARTTSSLGCNLAYWTRGSGPPVVLIQGTGVHGHGWLPQVEALATDYSCLWLDNRGMGASQPRGEAPITVEQMALDALAVMDAAGWSDAHLVGHSLGGCIALQLALSRPDRVRSLAVLCSSADGPELVRMTPGMIWRGLRMQLGTKRSRRRAFLEIVLTKAEAEAADLEQLARDLEPLFGHDLAVSPPIVLGQVRSMQRWSVMDRLGELGGIPTLVVGAAEDLVARPPLVRATAERIPGATLALLAGAAHGVPMTAPERINDLLRIHLAEADRPTVGGGSPFSKELVGGQPALAEPQEDRLVP